MTRGKSYKKIYFIRDKETGCYLKRVPNGAPEGYTKRIEDAKVYLKRLDAELVLVDNETIVEVTIPRQEETT